MITCSKDAELGVKHTALICISFQMLKRVKPLKTKFKYVVVALFRNCILFVVKLFRKNISFHVIVSRM